MGTNHVFTTKPDAKYGKQVVWPESMAERDSGMSIIWFLWTRRLSYISSWNWIDLMNWNLTLDLDWYLPCSHARLDGINYLPCI